MKHQQRFYSSKIRLALQGENELSLTKYLKKLEMDLKKIDEEIKESIFNTIQTEKQRDQVKEELFKLKSIACKEINFFSAQYEEAFQVVEEEKSKILDFDDSKDTAQSQICLLYTSPSPRDRQKSRMPSSA
eukprot:TRINITY_DN5560_c0_g1_i1.p1 TRINITY_DN5560_c0_g1~~TRINITY_DN5560_c0_g1_i1.p1  ORF type:complete len:131 (-),score=30.83 TRINITY_DN5560_c0_g1_i1:37-429(-)